jgi:hypothetical protein
LFPAFAAQAGSAGKPLEFAKLRTSTDAQRLVEWVQRTGDPGGRPFAVVDKRNAHVYVFDADGRLAGHTRALLGQTLGDHTVPGVGARAQTGEVGVDERTTPAGRFDAVPGRNLSGEHVVWADYASAFAIHRIRPGKAWKAREARLATPSAADNRVSYGCVVVPVAFYQKVVEQVLGGQRSVVYVLPETRSWQELFGTYAQQ